MKRILLNSLFTILALAIILGIAYGILAYLYFRAEPELVGLGTTALSNYQNAEFQVTMGRLVHVSSSEHYDIMIFHALRFHYYAYVPVGARFSNGMASLFSSFHLGLCENGIPVVDALGDAIVKDLLPLGIGLLAIPLGLLLPIFLKEGSKKNIIILVVLGVTSLYSVAALLWIKEGYSFLLASTFSLSLALATSFKRDNRPLYLTIAYTCSLSLSALVLFRFGYSYLHVDGGLGSLFTSYVINTGSWLISYSGFILTLSILIGPYIGFLFFLWSRKRKAKAKANAE